MDYVTRQFIVLTKKLRKEVRAALDILHRDIQKHTEAVAKANQASDKPAEPPPPSTINIPSGVETHKSQRDRTDEGNYQFWSLVFQVFTLLAVSVYAAVAIFQWCEMRRAANATHDAAVAATNANTLAAKGIDQALENSRLDERAWLGVDSINGIPKLNELFAIDVGIKNTGKTPAKGASVLTVYAPTKKGEEVNFHPISKLEDAPSRAMISPNSIYHANPATPTDVVKQGDLDVIKSGDVIIYVHGHMTYDDIFSCGHWLDFCYYLTRDTKSWAVCKQHNDTGDKQPHCPVTKPLEQKK